MKLNEIGDPRRGDAPSALCEPRDAIAFDAPALVVMGVRRGDLSPVRFALAVVEALAAASRPVVVHALRRADGAFEADADTRGTQFLAAGARAYRGGRIGPDAATIDATLPTVAAEWPDLAASVRSAFTSARRARSRRMSASSGLIEAFSVSTSARARPSAGSR